MRVDVGAVEVDAVAAGSAGAGDVVSGVLSTLRDELILTPDPTPLAVIFL